MGVAETTGDQARGDFLDVRRSSPVVDVGALGSTSGGGSGVRGVDVRTRRGGREGPKKG